MKNKAAFWLLLMSLVVTLILVIGPSRSDAQQGNFLPAAQAGVVNTYLSARATSTPSRPLTPTPLPAIYEVEQTHPGMIAGAAVLVLIIVGGVLAFSRHKA
jgi:hypothetical protein